MARPKQEPFFPITTLSALSPLDGRYWPDTHDIAPFFSEFALLKKRAFVEAKYLLTLSEEKIIRPFSQKEKTLLENIAFEMSFEDAVLIKQFEEETKHDVKALELFFRERLKSSSLTDCLEYIHFGLTSEDINNVAYRLMLHDAREQLILPTLTTLIRWLRDTAETEKETVMLARTHGQPAVPTTLGKELITFAMRLNKELILLEGNELTGKMNGAVGNLNALSFAKNSVDWISFSQTFIKKLGLQYSLATTQINPYEDIIAFLQTTQRINGILLDFSQDMWRYISDKIFLQKVIPGEVGSSVMTQKVNPIFFENAEGNLGIANALIIFFSQKLPASRLQRDLSDSTVIRNIGVLFGHSILAYRNLIKGLTRVSVNRPLIETMLKEDYSILTEGVQTFLREEGVKDAYGIIKTHVRGKIIPASEWESFIQNLPITNEQKRTLTKLTPQSYTGQAVRITEMCIKELKKKYD